MSRVELQQGLGMPGEMQEEQSTFNGPKSVEVVKVDDDKEGLRTRQSVEFNTSFNNPSGKRVRESYSVPAKTETHTATEAKEAVEEEFLSGQFEQQADSVSDLDPANLQDNKNLQTYIEALTRKTENIHRVTGSDKNQEKFEERLKGLKLSKVLLERIQAVLENKPHVPGEENKHGRPATQKSRLERVLGYWDRLGGRRKQVAAAFMAPAMAGTGVQVVQAKQFSENQVNMAGINETIVKVKDAYTAVCGLPAPIGLDAQGDPITPTQNEAQPQKPVKVASTETPVSPHKEAEKEVFSIGNVKLWPVDQEAKAQDASVEQLQRDINVYKTNYDIFDENGNKKDVQTWNQLFAKGVPEKIWTPKGIGLLTYGEAKYAFKLVEKSSGRVIMVKVGDRLFTGFDGDGVLPSSLPNGAKEMKFVYMSPDVALQTATPPPPQESMVIIPVAVDADEKVTSYATPSGEFTSDPIPDNLKDVLQKNIIGEKDATSLPEGQPLSPEIVTAFFSKETSELSSVYFRILTNKDGVPTSAKKEVMANIVKAGSTYQIREGKFSLVDKDGNTLLQYMPENGWAMPQFKSNYVSVFVDADYQESTIRAKSFVGEKSQIENVYGVRPVRSFNDFKKIPNWNIFPIQKDTDKQWFVDNRGNLEPSPFVENPVDGTERMDAGVIWTIAALENHTNAPTLEQFNAIKSKLDSGATITVQTKDGPWNISKDNLVNFDLAPGNGKEGSRYILKNGRLTLLNRSDNSSGATHDVSFYGDLKQFLAANGIKGDLPSDRYGENYKGINQLEFSLVADPATGLTYAIAGLIDYVGGDNTGGALKAK